MIPLPNGPFSIVLADPAWHYNDRPRTGTRFGGGAEEQYLDHDGDGRSTMSVEEIAGLPVRDVVADSAYLFMWATWPTFWESRDRNAFIVMEAWGFRVVTLGFLWVKTNPRGEIDGTRFGQGWYTKANSEPCFLGVRGKPWKLTDSISQIIEGTAPPHEVWAPVTRHSEKPDEVRRKIVEFCGDLPRLEMFARRGMPGWTLWGNQAEYDPQGTLPGLEAVR